MLSELIGDSRSLRDDLHGAAPEWSNIWNRVDIALFTHSAGGITRADLALAERIDGIAARFPLICDIRPDGSCGGCH